MESAFFRDYLIKVIFLSKVTYRIKEICWDWTFHSLEIEFVDGLELKNNRNLEFASVQITHFSQLFQFQRDFLVDVGHKFQMVGTFFFSIFFAENTHNKVDNSCFGHFISEKNPSFKWSQI